MARRRQEIALQTEVESQEEWNDTVNKEGLTVVDVYQQWAGSCKSVEGNFKRIKLETGETLLNFALSDVLIDAVIRANNAPGLQRKIMLNLDQEKRILKKGDKRVEIVLGFFFTQWN